MKRTRQSTQWLRLVFTGCVLTLATCAQAAKPVKPPSPPEPPPAPAYVPVALGMCFAGEINNRGQVIGACLWDATGQPTESAYACLLNPRDMDRDGKPDTWYLDENQDGRNDLLLSLGVLPGTESGWAYGVNDHGMVIGDCYGLTTKSFIVIPEDTDGDGLPDLWYRDTDGDGVNDLMVLLGTLTGAGGEIYCNAYDINELGQVVGAVGDGSYYNGFLLNPAVDAAGNVTWFQPTGVGDANALMVDLGAGEAHAINDLGQVIGFFGRASYIIVPADGNLDGQADCWFRDLNEDGVNDLATPLGLNSGLVGINNAGQIAGSRTYSSANLLTPEDTDGDGAADLWYRDSDGDGQNDLAMELGKLVPRLNGSRASGLNEAGWVVGSAFKVSGGYFPGGSSDVGFLCHDGQMLSLTELVGGVVTLHAPGGINDARQMICDGYILLPNP